MFIVGIILLLVALFAIIAVFVVESKGIAIAVAAAGIIIGGGILFFSSTYTQDTGEASVLVDWSGNIVGQETSPGLHGKAPWVNVTTFNIRNQSVSFVGDGTTDHQGGKPTGGEITVGDLDGVSSNIDVSLRYSIKPTAVTSIYKQFRNEDNFKTAFVQQDAKAAIRNVPNGFHTIQLQNSRAAIEAAIRTALESRWKDTSVTIDSVSLQDVRVPDAVKERWAQQQQAQIAVQTAKAKLEQSKVDAQQRIVQAEASAKAQIAAAEGSAKANHILENSLTDKVLQQHALDTLEQVGQNGGTVIVGGGAQTLLNLGNK